MAASKPLAPEVKPIADLLGWMMILFGIALILAGADVLDVSRSWFYGYVSAFGLVFLESIRLQAIHAKKEG